jgi:hypothetical protein
MGFNTRLKSLPPVESDRHHGKWRRRLWLFSAPALALCLVAAGVLPILAAGTFNRHIDELDLDGQRLVSDAWVINDEGTYRMWFTHLRTGVTPSQLVGLVSGLDLDAIFTALQSRDIEALLQHLSGLDPQTVYNLFKDSASVIGYATSSDGLTWSTVSNEVLAAAHELQMVAAPCVIKVGATYHMWYTRAVVDFTLGELSALLEDLMGTVEERLDAVIALAESVTTVIDHTTSADGITWATPSQGVVTGAGVFLGDSAGAPNVIWDGTAYQMWFSNLSTGLTDTIIEDMLDNISSLGAADLWQLQAGITASIGHATSTDGVTWTGLDRAVFTTGSGMLNSVITPCVLYDGADYEMWYSYGISGLTQDDISPIIDELSLIDITTLLALFEAEDYTGLIAALSDIIDNDIPVTKARLTGTATVIGYAESDDGLSWTVVEPVALAGVTSAPWSSVARPCVIKSGVAYEMWFTKGVDELSAQNLVDLWQGTVGTIGYASFSELGAETTSAVAVDGDGVVVVNMLVQRVKDAADVTTDVPGGMTGYNAFLSADPAGVELVTVRGVADFPTPLMVGLTFSCHDVSSPVQPADTVTAKVVLRLIGDCLTPYTVTLSYEAIRAAEPPGLSIPEDESFTYTFLRGDANNDGVVNIVDAMFIAQYVVTIRSADDLNILNGACVRHDGVVGDNLDIVDAMFIAQNVVGLRNNNFE